MVRMGVGDKENLSHSSADPPELRAAVRHEQLDIAMRFAPLLCLIDAMAVLYLIWCFWTPALADKLTAYVLAVTLLAVAGLFACWRWRVRSLGAKLGQSEQ